MERKVAGNDARNQQNMDSGRILTPNLTCTNGQWETASSRLEIFVIKVDQAPFSIHSTHRNFLPFSSFLVWNTRTDIEAI
jgi:hypothetical protein